MNLNFQRIESFIVELWREEVVGGCVGLGSAESGLHEAEDLVALVLGGGGMLR